MDEEHVLDVEEDGVAHFASFRRVASCVAIARCTAAFTFARLALRMGLSTNAAPVQQATPVQQAKRDARASAAAWLKLADAGLVDASWDALASGVKKEVSREQWRIIMARMRFGAGKVTARAIWRTVYTDKLMGAPPGTYVTVLYRSQFSRKGAAVENIPVALDADGKWRVCGYHADSPTLYLPAK